jgi:hypothetical protein
MSSLFFFVTSFRVFPFFLPHLLSLHHLFSLLVRSSVPGIAISWSIEHSLSHTHTLIRRNDLRLHFSLSIHGKRGRHTISCRGRENSMTSGVSFIPFFPLLLSCQEIERYRKHYYVQFFLSFLSFCLNHQIWFVSFDFFASVRRLLLMNRICTFEA